jgi:hypothetical protein
MSEAIGRVPQSLCPLPYRRVKPKGAPGLAFETWDPSNPFPLEALTLLFVIRSLFPLHYRRVKPMGAPGLAFETWDPSNQFLLETPTLLFVIRSGRQSERI